MPERTGNEVIKEIMNFIQIKNTTNMKIRSNPKKKIVPPVIFMISGYH